MTWTEPCDVTLFFIRPDTGSHCQIKTKFNGKCITISKEASRLIKQGWKLERTIPPQHEVQL